MSEPFIGEIRVFGFNFAPRGWAQCDGQLLSIAQNTALFSLLGTTYGGDGRTSFALPDLRGRAAIHEGSGPGLTPRSMGQKSGSETNTLNSAQLPSHTHDVTSTARCQDAVGNTNVATGNVWSKDAGVSSATYSTAGDTANMSANAIDSVCAPTGSSTPVNNMQPFLTTNYCIALQGIFPSRN